MTDTNELKNWFTQQIEVNMDSLYSFALRLTHNNADAEDLVAEAVIKAWSAIASLDNKQRFRPWILRILYNRFISDYRKKSIRPEESYHEDATDMDNSEEISTLLIKQSNEFLHWWANPELEICNQLLAEDIMLAIDALPEVFRITVLLVNVEGLSYDEAAAALEVPPGTIRSRMKRGRTLLQKELWQHARDAGLIDDNITREQTI